jgi:hypothetical protein
MYVYIYSCYVIYCSLVCRRIILAGGELYCYVVVSAVKIVKHCNVLFGVYHKIFCGFTFVCRPFIRVYFKIYLSKVNISTTKRWNSVELSTDVKVALFNYVIIKSIMLLFLFGIAFCLSLLTKIISRNSKALVLMWCMCMVRCVELGRV